MKINRLFPMVLLVTSQNLLAGESINLWGKARHTNSESGAVYFACSWDLGKQGRVLALFEIKTHKLLILELKRNKREDFPDGFMVDHAVELEKDFAPIKLKGKVIEGWNQKSPSIPVALIERLYRLKQGQTIEIDGSVLTVCTTDGMASGPETDGRQTGDSGGYVALVCSPRKSWWSNNG